MANCERHNQMVVPMKVFPCDFFFPCEFSNARAIREPPLDLFQENPKLWKLYQEMPVYVPDAPHQQSLLTEALGFLHGRHRD